MADDEALARSLAGSSMYDRVKVRRSGSNREEKKKIDALEAIRKKKKKEMKTVSYLLFEYRFVCYLSTLEE